MIQPSMGRWVFAAVTLLAWPVVAVGLGLRQHPLWQADLQIRSLTVTEAKGNLTARVIVGAEFGEALGARVEVCCPLGSAS